MTQQATDNRNTCEHCRRHARPSNPLYLMGSRWLCEDCYDCATLICRYGCADFCADYPECCRDGGD